MCYLGIDIGTTAVKGVLTDVHGNILELARREQKQHFPRSGWVEQDPQELLRLCLNVAEDVCQKHGIAPSKLRAIGIDHQGETCLVWDKATGEPLYPAIVWQDRRMAGATEAYDPAIGRRMCETTGLRMDSYYSAWKLRWLLDNIPAGQQRAENGEILAGTLNTWVIWKLSGRKVFCTDHSSAACTMMMDPRSDDWSDWILDELDLPRRMLPEIVSSDAVGAVTSPEAFFGAAVPITSSLTDGSAAVVSAGAACDGGFVATYGTGCFIHLVSDFYCAPGNGLTATCCLSLSGLRLFQLNGICYTAGAAVNWLRDGLGIISSPEETETLARSVEDSAGVFFVPAFNGMATPDWDQSARGAFLGLTAATRKEHMVRAVLESVALQVALCGELMQKASGKRMRRLCALGGMTSNGFLMQLQADLLGIPVCLPACAEPAYGSAMMAARALRGDADFRRAVLPSQSPMVEFQPRMSSGKRLESIAEWRYAVERCVHWHPDEGAI